MAVDVTKFLYQPQYPIGRGRGGSGGGSRPGDPLAAGKYLQMVMDKQRMAKMQQQEMQMMQQIAPLERALMEAQTQQSLAPKERSGADLLNRLKYDILQNMPPEKRQEYLLKPATSVSVDLRQAQKGTIGKLEDEMRELNKGIFGLEDMRAAYKPEYSTYWSKAKLWATAKREKGQDLPLIGEWIKPTEKQKAKLGPYKAWFGQAKTEFLTFRRWATGVAGGEKEMREIQTAFPDPVSSSPTEFLAMLDKAIAFRKAYRAEVTKYIMAGTVIDKTAKSKAAMVALQKSRRVGPPKQLPPSRSPARLPVVDPNKIDAIGNKFGF